MARSIYQSLVLCCVLCSLATLTGCTKESSTAPNGPSGTSTSSGTSQKETKTNESLASANEFLKQVKSGKVTADLLTDDFKRVIGEPLTPTEREKGFSDSAATDWCNRIGSRLQSTNLTYLNDGLYEIDRGTLKMVNQNGQWKVDWFHAGRSRGAEKLTEPDAGKKFAVARFADALATHNYELAIAALSDQAKANLAPALGRDVGFNRGTLVGKLKSIANSNDGYLMTISENSVTLAFQNAGDKKLKLTLENQGNNWKIGSLE
jgi:hypothetical protein